MVTTPELRWETEVTFKELAESLTYAFPGSKYEVLTKTEAMHYWRPLGDSVRKRPRAL
jgi:hypothetical protein